jgi:hypothetical protein
VGVAVVGRDDLHPPGQRDDAEQALSNLPGVDVGELAYEKRTFGPPTDAVELPG